MKLSVARSELLDSLAVAGKGLSARSTLPILSGILISASSDDGALLQATDLEVSVRTGMTALVEREGQAVLPGKLLTEIARNLPEASVSIDVEGDRAHIACEQASFTVKALPAQDFPKFPEVDPDLTVEMKGSSLGKMVRQVAKAVSRDETRAILTGILMVVDGPSARMVATDSYRLAVKDLVIDAPAAQEIEVVVPGRALEETARMAGDDSSVSIGVAENQIVFTFDGTEFVTRRIEGQFPNYQQLIPKETTTKVKLSTDELQGAVKRVALMAVHNSPLRVSVKPGDKTLSLSAATQDVGDASEDMLVEAEGEDVEIAFNHGFLMDGLASAEAEEVTLEIHSPLKPGVIKASGEGELTYLLMPVRLT
jgi:DNA polymerase-3 subunit beta